MKLHKARVATAAAMALREIGPETRQSTTASATSFIIDSAHIIGPSNQALPDQLEDLKELRRAKMREQTDNNGMEGVNIGYLASLAALDPEASARIAGCQH